MMETLKHYFFLSLAKLKKVWNSPQFQTTLEILLILIGYLLLFAWMIKTQSALAAPGGGGSIKVPGEDAADSLTAAGTLLKIIDVGLFKWGARLFAGICIMSAAWALKEQRFGIAVICVVGAVIFGTASKWVKNVFDVGGNESLFSSLVEPPQNPSPLSKEV